MTGFFRSRDLKNFEEFGAISFRHRKQADGLNIFETLVFKN
jgi:hypothetical protein